MNSAHLDAGRHLTLDEIDSIAGGKFGVIDVACPFCGPEKRSPSNQRRKVLRIWRTEELFATFYCSRCEEQGFVRRGSRRAAKRYSQILPSTHLAAAKSPNKGQIEKARWLWQKRQPLQGSLAEQYLRIARSYDGDLPERVGFLQARGDHSACMISALGSLGGDVHAVHLTRLSPDGCKAGTDADKIVIGAPRGMPIALMPINDGLGLLIAEGIEEALSGHAATGLGAWAAGNAPLLPYLAEAVPDYVECVTILVDDDKVGRRKSDELAERLEARGIETRFFFATRSRAA